MSLSFAAATDTVNVGSSAVLDDLTSFTYLTWIYPTSALVSGGIVAKGTSATNSRRSFEIRTSVVSNGLYVSVDYATTNSLAEANVIVTDKWQFVGCTHDGVTRMPKLYYGDLTTLATEPTYSTVPQAGTGAQGSNAALNQFVGSFGAGTSGGAGKRLAHVAIFNRVLSAGEIQSWQFNPRVLSGCVGFWELGNTGTATQPDLSGNGNAGTVTGATQIANPPVRRVQYTSVAAYPLVVVGGGAAMTETDRRRRGMVARHFLTEFLGDLNDLIGN